MTTPDHDDGVSRQKPSQETGSCPACSGSQFLDFLTITGMPVSDGVLRRTPEEALRTPRGDISLACCQTCGYVGNRKFDPSKLIFNPEYMISLHHSPLYNRFLEDLCDDLADRYQLKGRSALEIGCGQGYFTELLGKRGSLTSYGYDPAVKENQTIQGKGFKVILSSDDYSSHCAAIRPQLISCRHVLQLITDPRGFMQTLRSHLDWEPPAAIYFELPNASSVFRSDGVWCIMYEYRSYFCETSLASLFEHTGFAVQKVGPCFVDGQYLQLEATPTKAERPGPVRQISGLLEQAGSFATAYRSEIERWGNRLADLVTAKKRIVAWGSGGRAICFFHALQIRDQISYVVDINPDRQNCYLPSTAQKIVAPEFLIEYRPDVIIVTNPTYVAEIRQQVAGMGLTSEVVSL